MWMLLVLAARNLRRHARRTVITACAIAVGLFFFIAGSILGDGAYRAVVENAVALTSGHVVVQAKGYQEERESALVVKGASVVKAKLEASYPDATVVPRVFMQGLLTSTQGSSGIGVTGVDPAIETRVGSLHEKLVEGEFVGESKTDIVVGATLAESLGVGLGDKVVFMHQQGSELKSQLFRVKGIFKTGAAEIDGFFALVSLPAAQAALGLDDAVHQVALMLSQDRDLDADVARIRIELGRGDLEVLTWMKAMPDVYEYIVVDRMGMWVMIGLIAVIAIIGVLNTVLMSVLERTREFGTMLALGMKPRRLSLLVMFEAILLGALSAVLGAIGGGALGMYFVETGLDYSSMVGGAESMTVAGVPMEMVMYGHIYWDKFFLVSFLTVVVVVVASLYPMWWVSRLKPVEAMARRK